MQETRRQLFKTSILSAFGLMAVTSVAKAAGSGTNYAIARTTDINGQPTRDLLIQYDPSGAVSAFYITDLKKKRPFGPPWGSPIEATVVNSDDYDLRRVKKDTFYIGGTKVDFEKGEATGNTGILLPSWNEIGGAHGKLSTPPYQR